MKFIKYIPMLTLLTLTPFMITSCNKNTTHSDNENTEQSSAKPYPLDTCLISGEKLGTMGPAYSFVYKDQAIKMCCKKCLPKFNKNPEKYLNKLEQSKNSKRGHDEIDHSDHKH